MKTGLFFVAILFYFFNLGDSQKDFENSSSKFNFPSYNPNYPPPEGEINEFKLSQSYPDTFNTNAKFPWSSINFKQNPKEYMSVVLKYCIEGNDVVDFVVQNNSIRKWYHTPWLHDDGNGAGNGREFKHGLTRERGTPKYELGEDQDIELENWAVGFYNDRGGYTIGKVWQNDTLPDPNLATFPEGTVSFKLLFTDGTADKIPFIMGSKEWEANIYPCAPYKCKDSSRINRKVRLLQIDIAVKDNRAGDVGWVFGTFVYNGFKSGQTIWERMDPVGLSWGDDGDNPSHINREGAFINEELKHTYLNPDLIRPEENQIDDRLYLTHHGLGGRLNGPVDNPISSCISCHGRAAVNLDGKAASNGNFKLSRENYTVEDFKKYFSPVKGGSGILKAGDKNYLKTDYSLQLSTGIRNFYTLKPKYVEHKDTINEIPLVDRGDEFQVPDTSLKINVDESECDPCSYYCVYIIYGFLSVLIISVWISCSKIRKIRKDVYLSKKIHKFYTSKSVIQANTILIDYWKLEKVNVLDFIGFTQIKNELLLKAFNPDINFEKLTNDELETIINLRKVFIEYFANIESFYIDINRNLFKFETVYPYLKKYLLAWEGSINKENELQNTIQHFLTHYSFTGVLNLLDKARKLQQ